MEFIHTFGDLHLYANHIEQAREQLARECRPLPRMRLNPEVKSIDAFASRISFSKAMTHILPSRRLSRCEGDRCNVLEPRDRREGKIPWHLPEDLKFFKRTTLGPCCFDGTKDL